MARPSVLIAGFSGRALAASARRAGYAPLVVDAFGDADTREIAEHCEVVPGALRVGFGWRTLSAALSRIASRATSPPIGLILGAGFEDHPALAGRLAEHYRLLGCSPETIAATKDPDRFFSALADLGIVHPETHRAPPSDTRGWLTKRIGGSGGNHIARCRTRASQQRDRYFQREIDGEPLSMTGIVGAKGAAFAFARPTTAPMPRRPFRYGGLSASLDIHSDLEARLIGIGLDLTRRFGLTGLVSFDFIVREGTPTLLEVNPRPGAAIDVFDDDAGTLFKAHIAATDGEDPTRVLSAGWRPKPSATACLYADDGPLVAPQVSWPEWTCDRPLPGITIAQHMPLLTILARAPTREAAATLATQRLGETAAMLYGRQKKTEGNAQ